MPVKVTDCFLQNLSGREEEGSSISPVPTPYRALCSYAPSLLHISTSLPVFSVGMWETEAQKVKSIRRLVNSEAKVILMSPQPLCPFLPFRVANSPASRSQLGEHW